MLPLICTMSMATNTDGALKMLVWKMLNTIQPWLVANLEMEQRKHMTSHCQIATDLFV